MLKIRLQRVGKKHEPTYRVVVCDSKRGPKSGDNIEILGSYDARDKNETKVNAERAKYWIDNGAQVSDTVHNLLINLGITKGEKINVLPKKSPIIDEEKIKAQEEAASKEAEETIVEDNEVKNEESKIEPDSGEKESTNANSDEMKTADASSDVTTEEKSAQ